MKRMLIALTIMAALLTGCGGYNNAEDFAVFAGKFHAQMFTDGMRSDKVVEMYEELKTTYSSETNSDLYEAIDGMYNGLENGNATKYQLEVMRLLNE